MGKEQGDELPEAVWYQHEDFEDQRPAYTGADHVNLAARGWTPVEGQETDETTAPVAAEKPAGSQRRGAGPRADQHPAAVPADGGATA